MQTADDRNGSSNNTTIISTTIINDTTSENDNNTNVAVTQHQHLLSQSNQQNLHQTHSTETTNVLRHRVTATNTNCSAITVAKNDLWHLIDSTNDCVDSNVECVSVTPTSSLQASPVKCNKLKTDLLKLAVAGGVGMHSIVINTPLQDTYKTNTSSESSSSSKNASNSTPTTSSVIATPVLGRNGDIYKCKEQCESANVTDSNEDNSENLKGITTPKAVSEGIGACDDMEPHDYISVVEIGGTAEYCKQFRECNKKQLLTNQRLPCENTSTANIIKTTELSFSSLPMSSSTTSLSITQLSVADPNKQSSSSASTVSVTSVSATTTPALLSTTSSSSTSSYSSLSSTPSAAESKIKGMPISGLVKAELLHWQDMPQYLQFNPYVLKGYRPLTTFKGCLLSLFYWHNETINILTHAIPIVYILAIVPGLMPWESGYRFLSFCHVFGAVAPWCGSFIYHLFMNIEQGENVYKNLLKLDMLGIWVSQSFGALPLLTASTFCFTFKWKWFIIMSYCLLSFWGLYKALTASSPWQRRLCFGLPFAMRSILTFFRTIGLVGGNRVALAHVFLQDGVSIVGGAIGAMRIPEKWFPGLVDFYLNSHNIMHVLVVVAVYSMYKATMKDFEWMETVNCDAFVNISSKVLESTLNTKIEL